MNKATRELLEQHFDTAFAAPDGVKKLRELILMLAMQGKLVAQDPNDPPASQLLEEIKAEKKRLVKAGKIKAPKPLPEIKSEEVPYALPHGWEWVRLGEIGVWKSGSTPSRTNSKYYGGNIPWVKSGEVKQGRIAQTEESITELALAECSLSLNPKGSVLVAMYGANIGEVGILDIEATTNQAVCACNTYTAFDEKYLLKLIASLKRYFISQGAGAAQPNISREKIVSTLFPLPPLPEQHRIVAKIEQLMVRCDELEKLRAEREQRRISVHTAAINRLTSPTASFPRRWESMTAENLASRPCTPEGMRGNNDGIDSLNAAWQFITQHFAELYAVKPNVAELRKAILQLAVMGKLVPQDPNDPPASELLKEIEAEKHLLVAQGLYRNTEEKESGHEVVTSNLPEQWELCTIQQLGFVLGGKRLPKGHDYCDVPTSHRYLTVTNMKNSTIIDNEVKYITPETHAEIAKYVISKDDLYITIAGTIGSVGVVPEHCNGMNLTENAAKLVFFRCNKEYLVYLLNSGVVQDQFNALTNKMAQPKLALRSIQSTVILLPPLPEQQRIVAKIDSLMALCDTLEQQIDAATSKQTALLDAVMSQV